MTEDTDLKMFEIKAGLEEIKEEMEKLKRKNMDLKNNMTFNSFMEKVDDFQRKNSNRLETMEGNLTTLTTAVSNNDQILSEIRDALRQQNEALRTINQTLNKQDKTIQVLKNNVETETILLLGGYDGKSGLDSLLMLENNRDKWKELNIKLPYAVYSHGAQFLNNNLYIFGGYNEKDKQLNYTYKLSKSLQWEKMADMNKKRRDISNGSVLLNNQIWVCGGLNKNGDDLNSVEMYDPQTNKWKYMKEMNESRSETAAAVVNGKIFCSGYYSVECYDPSSDVWTRICNMPTWICGHGAVEIDGNLVVIGGYSGGYLNNVWALDITNKNAVWIEKPSMSIPRDYFSIAKIHDKVFVCGGKNNGKTTDYMEIFDGEVWRHGPNMPTSRDNACAVVIPMSFARYLS